MKGLLIFLLLFMSMCAFGSDGLRQSKTLPPEIVDAIISLIGVAVGWLARWLKGDIRAMKAEKKVAALESYINSKSKNQ